MAKFLIASIRIEAHLVFKSVAKKLKKVDFFISLISAKSLTFIIIIKNISELYSEFYKKIFFIFFFLWALIKIGHDRRWKIFDANFFYRATTRFPIEKNQSESGLEKSPKILRKIDKARDY